MAFRIITPFAAVNVPFHSLPKNTSIIPIPPINKATEIALIITEPGVTVSGWPGKNSMNNLLIASLPLDTGEIVWLVHRVIDIPDLGTLQGKATYLNAKSKADLHKPNLRGLIFADSSDGSMVIIENSLIHG